MAGAPVLLAANFSEGTLDAYDTNLALVAQFTDPRAPAGYAPFNVQSVAGMIFVTFAKQDAEKEDDVKGRGHGLIDVFDPATATFHRLATGTDAGGRLPQINSPWGVALAPNTFGEHAGQLLVGNFGSGTIMAFDSTGRFRGLLEGTGNEEHFAGAAELHGAFAPQGHLLGRMPIFMAREAAAFWVYFVKAKPA